MKKTQTSRKPQATSYERGYSAGRKEGFQQGREAGIQTGYREMKMQVCLVITPAIELPSLEIELLQPFRYMKQHGQYNYLIRHEDAVKREDIASADIVVFIRNVEPAALAWLRTAHELGKRTVYVIDDNFLEIPDVKGIADYYKNPDRRNHFMQMLREASLVKVDSHYFANYIRLYYNPKVVCFPSSIDFDWLDQEQKPARTDGRIVIGYEGTVKDDDFVPVVQALTRIMQEHAHVNLEFYGYIPESLQKLPRVAYTPMNGDYRHFMHQMVRSTWDIGLAPLADTVFNYCKTNVKLRDYGSCGIAGVYSINPAYTDWVVHEETGYFVPHTETGWYEGLTQMISRPDLRQKIRTQAAAYARQHFALPVVAEQWRQQVLQA